MTASKKQRKRKRKTLIPRHPFLLEMVGLDGEQLDPIKAMAKTKLGTKTIDLVLKPWHVERSIRNDGCGSTQKCAMAVCVAANKDLFPHPVENVIDWTYGRVFVASKRKGGLPSECYAYEHNGGEVAKLNDSKNGQKQLLRRLEQDGEVIITLRPYRRRSEAGRNGRDRPITGSRIRNRDTHRVGAAHRSASARLSGALPISELGDFVQPAE